ncbi:MAG: SDR family NAD(P)-dependent oxidoreductase [Gemmatimonadetes bacterium]|nr:SDR family NAD(P)-dependent oxidoreductase [Gemmatimonadota bacterium]MYA64191.1 SDR family NAD(P)-dependent oxidoreductase [Gemmatimonadota bacterium]MYB98281.1 SDR family NAD(P)-dependent oxidoreductase [Gemmatimonadota bacterium]MYH51461.1 SDR family NAD(P)-dependent oxidoreductase [Gemmatimonadota bacterium]MYI47229.1 SDR family NAD(P)-dependent oxidoreductase [Gemmatimonadota bacterium]
MPDWTAEDIPVPAGRTVVVTGGNTGLGFRSVREFARRRARVFLTSRSGAKGRAAAEAIMSELPKARVEGFALDLTGAETARCGPFCWAIRRKRTAQRRDWLAFRST